MSAKVPRHAAVSPLARRLGRALASQRGAVLVIVAGGMVVLLGMAGLAIDSGRAFLVKSRLSRAVDAGVLAGARWLRSGQDVARTEALAVAEANHVLNGQSGVTIDLSFGQNAHGEQTVTMTARQSLPTVLMRLLGRKDVPIASTATAAVTPVDLVLVVDQSGSMRTEDAWDDLQDAVSDFVEFFDDRMDRVGLVSFATRGTRRYGIQHHFTADIQRTIQNMSANGWTNAGDGLRLAHDEISGAGVRPNSVRVVVFFTDGRPTILRGPIGGRDRLMAVRDQDLTGMSLYGYFNNPDDVPAQRVGPADGCSFTQNCRDWTEAGRPPHGPVAREIARQQGIAQADRIRQTDTYIYSIGLGNPNAPPIRQPDMDFLALLANEHGAADPQQPRGHSYFAPSPAELRDVFRRVASDLVIRLAR